MPLIHFCFNQHLNERIPDRKCSGECKRKKRRCICKRCKCRQEVSAAEARRLVETGSAEYVVIRRDPIPVKHNCPMCSNDELLKKSCIVCNKSGHIEIIVLSPVRSNDIVAVTRGSGDTNKEVFRAVLSKQTPRVATVEFAHICRAFINGNEEERQRIEAYGETNKEFLNSLIVPFIRDPWEGRTLFTFVKDERTK